MASHHIIIFCLIVVGIVGIVGIVGGRCGKTLMSAIFVFPNKGV